MFKSPLHIRLHHVPALFCERDLRVPTTHFEYEEEDIYLRFDRCSEADAWCTAHQQGFALEGRWCVPTYRTNAVPPLTEIARFTMDAPVIRNTYEDALFNTAQERFVKEFLFQWIQPDDAALFDRLDVRIHSYELLEGGQFPQIDWVCSLYRPSQVDMAKVCKGIKDNFKTGMKIAKVIAIPNYLEVLHSREEDVEFFHPLQPRQETLWVTLTSLIHVLPPVTCPAPTLLSMQNPFTDDVLIC